MNHRQDDWDDSGGGASKSVGGSQVLMAIALKRSNSDMVLCARVADPRFILR